MGGKKPRRSGGEKPARATRRRVLDVAITHPRGAPFRRLLRARAGQYLDGLGVGPCELSISLVTDSTIRELNRAWRGKDRATDVLSFPAGPEPGGPGPWLLGDVVLSLDTAARVAREEGRAVEAELERYLAHGLLHLLGHDHHRPAEARRMAALEERLLGGKGLIPARGARSGSPVRSRVQKNVP